MSAYCRQQMTDPMLQVTTIQADAADEKAIEGLCKQALREEGRLDVFFANVCTHRAPAVSSLISLGWSSKQGTIGVHLRRIVHVIHADKRVIVRHRREIIITNR